MFENDEELRPMVLQAHRRGVSEGAHGEEDVGLGLKGKGAGGIYFPGQGEDMYGGGGYGQVGQRGPITMEEGERGTEFYRNQ